MNIDPDREITITIPFGMVERLLKVKPILSMFRDDADVRAVMEILDAMYAGALEFLREEEGELLDYLAGTDSEFPPDEGGGEGTNKS